MFLRLTPSFPRAFAHAVPPPAMFVLIRFAWLTCSHPSDFSFNVTSSGKPLQATHDAVVRMP